MDANRLRYLARNCHEQSAMLLSRAKDYEKEAEKLENKKAGGIIGAPQEPPDVP